MKLLNGSISSVNAAALLLGVAGLLSRILGVFRDRLLASHFGAGRALDIYYAAFQIPDLMSVLFILGAASSAILPVFQEYYARDEVRAKQLIHDLTVAFLFGATCLALAMGIAAPWILKVTVPGFSPEERELTALLTRIMLLSPIVFGLSGIYSSVVQSFHRFFAYAIAPILYNMGIIFGILILLPRFGMAGLAMGVVFGACMHLGVQFWTVRALGFAPISLRMHIVRALYHNEGVRKVARISLPRVLSISLAQITLLVLVGLGSTLEEGSISVFQLAQNLYFVPIGLFGISYATALFPRLNTAYIRGDGESFFNNLFLGIRMIFFWMAPSIALYVVMRAHIVRVALGAGSFSWEDTRLTSAVLGVFAISLFADGVSALLIKSFYALESTWKPLIINFCASLFSVATAWICVRELSHASWLRSFLTALFRIQDLPRPEVLGLALGFSLGIMINIVFLYIALHKLASARFRYVVSFPFASLIKMTIAASVAAGIAYGVRVSFAATLPLINFSQVLIQFALASAVGFAAYLGVLFLLRSEEVHSFVHTMRGKIFRLGVLPKSWNSDITHLEG